MFRKNYRKMIAILLCLVILFSSSNIIDVNAEVGEIQKISSISKTEFQIIPFAVGYIEALDCIKALWEYDDNVNFKLYLRPNNDLEFTLYTITEQRDANIPTELFDEFCDFRLTVEKKDLYIESEIITIHKNGSTYQTIKRDTDGDSINDGLEIWELGTDPFNADSDEDGFSDGYEVFTLFTDPLIYTENIDIDNDGIDNLKEMELGTNPYLFDSDFDGYGDNVDGNPLITDYKSKKNISYAAPLVLSPYDKKITYTNADSIECIIIFNKLNNAIKYCQIGEEIINYYFYDLNDNLTVRVTQENEYSYADTYAYDNDNHITFIGHEGISYQFEYNDNGELINTKIGEQIIASHSYDGIDSVQTVFSNNQVIDYEYSDDKIDKVIVNGEAYYETLYDDNGYIVSQNDLINGVTYNYEYDQNYGLSTVKVDTGFEIYYNNDTEGRPFISYICDGVKKESQQYYNDDSLVKKLEAGGMLYQTDNVEEKSQNLKLVNDEDKTIYTSIILGLDNNEVENIINNKSYFYKFDNNGNVIEVIINDESIRSFIYDNKNRLIRSNNKEINETVIYEYDNNNNIISEKHYDYTLDEPQSLQINNVYQYNDENWKDLLTSYNGNIITYDEIGNPINYINSNVFSWDQGRYLSKVDREDLSVTYKYNSSGLRTQKSINGTITNYHLDENKIILEETNGEYIWYSYDSNGRAAGFEYKDDLYFYQKNIQNDVTGIYNNDGELIVSYIYDDWGNIIEIIGNQTIGSINKFRYRSYYYDDETGFYYLESRYYDCETGRFLNADEKLASYNAFAYCSNNPINYSDYDGHDAVTAFVCIGLIFATFLLLYYFFIASDFMSSWTSYIANDLARLVSKLVEIGSAITQTVINSVYAAGNDVSMYIASKISAYSVSPTFNNTHNIHHIVAENASPAAQARIILNYVNIDVNDPLNLVAIRTGVHQHLHTTTYYNFVNLYLDRAYYAAQASRKYNAVASSLNEIRIFLLAISAASPF